MVRVGIVGCSNIGRNHAKNFLKCADAGISAYCDIKEEPRAVMREEVLDPAGLKPAEFDDFEKMLDEAEVDAVTIVLPHSLHFPYIMKALEQGKHVLVEKPMVTNSGEAAQVVAKCAETGKLVEIAFQSVYTAGFQWIREQSRQGAFGEIVFVHGQLYQGWLANLERKPEKKWRLSKETSGGGQLYDSGSHLLNGMLWATELKPARVYAEIDNRGEEVDVCSSLSIRFDNGAVGNVAISGETFMTGMTSRLLVTGTKLEISVHHSGQDLLVFGPGAPKGERPQMPPGTTPQANFVEAILGKSDPLCPAGYGLTLAKFMDAVYASADQRRPIDVPA